MHLKFNDYRFSRSVSYNVSLKAFSSTKQQITLLLRSFSQLLQVLSIANYLVVQLFLIKRFCQASVLLRGLSVFFPHLCLSLVKSEKEKNLLKRKFITRKSFFPYFLIFPFSSSVSFHFLFRFNFDCSRCQKKNFLLSKEN